MRAGYKGGWSGRKCLAMHTIMVAKLKKEAPQIKRLYSIVFTMGDIFSNFVFL